MHNRSEHPEEDQSPSPDGAENSQQPASSGERFSSAETEPDGAMGIWEWDLKRDQLDLDDRACDLLKAEPGDADALFELIHPDDRTAVRQALDESLEQEERDFRSTFRLQDGQNHHRIEAAGRVVNGPHGEPERLIGTMRAHQKPNDELQEQQTNVKRAVASSGHGVMMTDPDGIITYVNQQLEQMSGYTRSELEGKRPGILDSDQHDKGFFRDLRDTIKAGDTWQGEVVNKNKSGERFHTWQTIVPVVDDQGNVQSYLSIWQDVTDQKRRSQELLQKSRAIEASPVGITIADMTRPDQPLCYVNEQFERLTGYDKQEVIGENCRFLQGDDTDPDKVDRIREAISNNEMVQVELRNYRKDGELFWNQLILSPIHNNEGDVTRYVGYQQDVTERKAYKQKLQVFRDSMNKSPEEIYILDPNTGRFIDFTDTVREDLGYSADELLDMTIHDIAPVYQDTLEWEERVQGLKQDGPVRFESTHRRKDGSTFPVEVHADHIVVDGSPRIVAAAHDISDRLEQKRKIERQAQLLNRINDRMPGITFQFKRDVDGSYSLPYMSKGFKQFAGITTLQAREDFNNVIDQIHPGDREDFLASIEQSADTMTPWKFEWRFTHPPGKETWVRGSSVPDEQSDGSIIWTGVFVDVTEEKERYNELNLQKKRFETLFNNAPIGLSEEDWSGVKLALEQLPGDDPEDIADYLHANPEALRGIASAADVILPNDTVVDMTGAENKQQLIDQFEDILTEETFVSFRAEIISLLHGETSYSSTMSLRRFDGGERNLLRDVQLVPGHESDWSRVFVSYRDITQRVEMEQALRDSEEKFRQLAENIQDVFWMTEPDKNEMIYVSPAYEEIWGRSRDDLYDNPRQWVQQIHPEDRDRIQSIIPGEQKKGNYDEKYRIVRPDGEVRWVHDRAYPITDEDGHITRITGIAKDITERVEMEHSLRRSEERYRTLFEEANEAFLVENTDDRILNVNQTACDLLGYDRDELIGMDLAEIRPPEMVDAYPDQGIVESLLDEHGRSMFTTEYLDRDGNRIPVEAKYQAFEYDEDTTGVLACLRDRSELEQMRKENDRKSSFVSRVTHDLRTPLNSILGIGQLLMETDLSPEQQERLRVMLNATRTMERLTNDILDLDRIEQGKIELEQSTFNLRNLLGEVLSLYSEQISNRNLMMSTRIENDVPELLVGDPNRLKQILHNLVENAVKHTDEGTICVSVDVREQSESGTMLEFSVSDTGSGIPDEELERIFNRGEQVSDGRTAASSGLGIGLSICQTFVELMNGHIDVESEVGDGTTFTFTAEFREGLARADVSLDTASVLIVDDNEHVLNIFRTYLEAHDIDVVQCTSGEGARDELLQTAEEGTSPFSAVFLDRRLPDVSGLDLVRELENKSDGVPPDRVFIVTGDPRETVYEEIEGIDVAGVLEKPVSESTMISALTEIIERDLPATPDHPDPVLETIKKRSDVPLNILLVEDTPETQEMLTSFLDPISERVETVENGEDGVEQYKTQRPDLILMDIELAGTLNGLEATEQIREHESERDLEPVPIICQTALAMSHVEQQSYEAGATAFIRQPIDRLELYKAIRDVLQNDGQNQIQRQ